MKKDPIIKLDSYFPFLLRSISGRINSKTKTISIGKYRIGMREWRIIAIMAESGIITNKDISYATGMDKASISRSFKYLEQQELIKKTIVLEKNWRNKPYELTSEGDSIYHQIATNKLSRVDELWQNLSKEERDELIRLLGKLKQNVYQVLDNDL